MTEKQTNGIFFLIRSRYDKNGGKKTEVHPPAT